MNGRLTRLLNDKYLLTGTGDGKVARTRSRESLRDVARTFWLL